jgi:hypothetical protein
MGRFNVIKDLAETFVQLTGVQLQAWMAPVFFLAVGIVLFPLIRRSHRVGKARKRLRLIPYRRLAERRRLEDDALGLVRGHPGGQLELAREAARLGRRDLARRALAAMEASGKLQRKRLALARELDPPPSHSALDAHAAIELLVREGLLDEARRRLVRAQQRWPDVSQWPSIPAAPPAEPAEPAELEEE